MWYCWLTNLNFLDFLKIDIFVENLIKLETNIFIFYLTIFFLAKFGRRACFFLFFFFWFTIIKYIFPEFSEPNSTLANGFVYLHIWWVYILLFIQITIFLLFFSFLKKKKKIFLFFKKSILIITKFTTLNIVFGIMWANQEVIWDFWWSWDPVEILNVTIFSTLLFLYHNKFTSYKNFYNLIKFSFLAIIINRSNLFESIHLFIENLESPNVEIIIQWNNHI